MKHTRVTPIGDLPVEKTKQQTNSGLQYIKMLHYLKMLLWQQILYHKTYNEIIKEFENIKSQGCPYAILKTTFTL